MSPLVSSYVNYLPIYGLKIAGQGNLAQVGKRKTIRARSVSDGFGFRPPSLTLRALMVAFAGKEGAQDARAAVGQDAPDDLGAMVKPAIGGNLVEGVAGAGFRIGSAVHHGWQPGQNNGGGTHPTRF